MSKTIEVQMREILDHASKEVREATQRAGEITAKEAVQKLKNTSPKSEPHNRRYAEGWAQKKEHEGAGVQTVIVYNRTNPQLTHLLENGHMIVNQHGTYGRTQAIKHIEPVEEWSKSAFPDNFEKEFKP